MRFEICPAVHSGPGMELSLTIHPEFRNLPSNSAGLNPLGVAREQRGKPVSAATVAELVASHAEHTNFASASRSTRRSERWLIMLLQPALTDFSAGRPFSHDVLAPALSRYDVRVIRA